MPGRVSGAVLASRIDPGDLERLRHRHWSVVVVPEPRGVLSAAPLVRAHLERGCISTCSHKWAETDADLHSSVDVRMPV